jgi:hypothetical protein
LTFDSVLQPYHKGLALTLQNWLSSLLVIKPQNQEAFWKKKSTMLNVGQLNAFGKSQRMQQLEENYEKIALNIEDVFLGFNEETLTSLVLLHSKYSAVCFSAERDDIINACKRDLINIASSFLMLILPRSKLFHDN